MFDRTRKNSGEKVSKYEHLKNHCAAGVMHGEGWCDGNVGIDQNRQDTGFFIQSLVRLKTPIR